MTSRRRGVGLTPMETRRDVIVRAAMLADELGYESFSVPEGWGLDSTSVLTEIALRTTRIQIASGVLSVWGRTPATLAMTAATLHQVSGGRYVLDTIKGADLGQRDGLLVLDFNFAYQPSCSYDPRWSCPLAPPANRLAHEVRAGERMNR